MRTIRRFAAIAALAALGCGGGDDDDGGNPAGPGGGGGATNGSFTVTINGTTWRATGNVSVTRGQNNFIGIAGTGLAGSTTYAIVVGIANATGPGTHTLNVFSGGDGSSVTIGSGAAVGYSTGLQGGSGTLTVTSVTSNRIVGTFSGTAIPAGSGGPNLVLTSGTFDLTF
jgi:hypothetical protein